MKQDELDSLFGSITGEPQTSPSGSDRAPRPLFYRAVLREYALTKWKYHRGPWQQKIQDAKRHCVQYRLEGFPTQAIWLEISNFQKISQQDRAKGVISSEWTITTIKDWERA